jgi:hypothetical protein
MSGIEQLLALVLVVGAFVGLIAYRTWADRRNSRK